MRLEVAVRGQLGRADLRLDGPTEARTFSSNRTHRKRRADHHVEATLCLRQRYHVRPSRDYKLDQHPAGRLARCSKDEDRELQRVALGSRHRSGGSRIT
jgi:hypothetical protein